MTEEEELPTAAFIYDELQGGKLSGQIKEKARVTEPVENTRVNNVEELVRREDAEEFAEKKFRHGRIHGEEREQRRILELIDQLEESYLNGDNATKGILNKAELLQDFCDKIRGELEKQESNDQSTEV